MTINETASENKNNIESHEKVHQETQENFARFGTDVELFDTLTDEQKVERLEKEIKEKFALVLKDKNTISGEKLFKEIKIDDPFVREYAEKVGINFDVLDDNFDNIA